MLLGKTGCLRANKLRVPDPTGNHQSDRELHIINESVIIYNKIYVYVCMTYPHVCMTYPHIRTCSSMYLRAKKSSKIGHKNPGLQGKGFVAINGKLPYFRNLSKQK